MRKQCVAPSVPSADMKSTASELGKLGKGSRNRRFVNGNPTRAEDLVPMRSIDSGCAACALSVGVASAVGMSENTSLQLRELGFETPTLKFQNEDVHSLKFSVMDKLHKPLVAASKVVAASSRIMLQPSKRRKRIFERSEVFVLPCWVVKGSSQKRLEPLDESRPNDRQVHPRDPCRRKWSRAC